MSKFLKKWLSDRGTTAVQVAKMAGIEKPELIWKVLSGRKELPETMQQFADTLLNVYGMTEAELKEAIAI